MNRYGVPRIYTDRPDPGLVRELLINPLRLVDIHEGIRASLVAKLENAERHLLCGFCTPGMILSAKMSAKELLESFIHEMDALRCRMCGEPTFFQQVKDPFLSPRLVHFLKIRAENLMPSPPAQGGPPQKR